jgi:Bacteriophage related domain of unknown function
MSYVDARIALETRLKDNWTQTPIKWENVRFDPPVSGTNNPQPYIAFLLRDGVAEDIALGSWNPIQRYTGTVMVQVLVPEKTGMGLATQYGEFIKNIYLKPPRDFQYQQSGMIRLFPPYLTTVGELAGWTQVNVLVPFRRDARPPVA